MLKKYFKFLILIVIITTSFYGCRKEAVTDCFKSSGKPSTEERQLESFNKIEVFNSFNIVLSQDSSKAESAIIIGGSNLLSSVKMDVKDSTLIITNENTCNWVRDYDNRITIELNIHSIKKLTSHDDVYINTAKKLNFEKFYISHSGMGDLNLELNITKYLQTNQYSAGEITLKGYAAVFVASVEDVGGMYASELQGDYTYVFHYGTNECHVKPKKEFGVSIYYTGNVYYYAEPKKFYSTKLEGKGQLIKMF